MNRAVNNDAGVESSIESIVGALRSGWILVDHDGNVVWTDHGVRQRFDGELRQLDLPLKKDERSMDCFITTAQVMLDGEPQDVCVIQATDDRQPDHRELRRLIVAIEDAMADPQWFTQPLIEKLNAWRQSAQPAARVSDLDVLTAREREILALICEGRTDAEMGRVLKLSQNTIRNHVASLFRKIGVNRRSAAVIWARERAITRHDVLAFPKTRRVPPV